MCENLKDSFMVPERVAFVTPLLPSLTPLLFL